MPKTIEELEAELTKIQSEKAALATELEKWTAFSRGHEKEADRLKTEMATKIAEAVTAAKAETSKEIKTYQAKEAAREAGLRVAAADRLRGETYEELLADAKALAEEFGTTVDEGAAVTTPKTPAFKPVQEQGADSKKVAPTNTIKSEADFVSQFEASLT